MSDSEQTALSITTKSNEGALGLNAWLVEEMYQSYKKDPGSVSESWQEFFQDYQSHVPSLEQIPEALEVPKTETVSIPGKMTPAGKADIRSEPFIPDPEVEVIRGGSKKLVDNMVASLAIPTATSVHPVPAKLLEVNRQIINSHLARISGGKVSFTHLIGWAIVKAVKTLPSLNAHFVEDADGKGNPGKFNHPHIGLGIAIDLERANGRRNLVVPVIKAADTLGFQEFVHAYEDLVRRARQQKLTSDDLQGASITLTNPGTLGTTQSVPRLMPGTGVIVGVGAISYPADLQGADPSQLAELGIGKVVTLTSTYDHRIIQGAESGMFLQKIHELVVGRDSFYEEIFDSLQIQQQPASFNLDNKPSSPLFRERNMLEKQVSVKTLIQNYRLHGHKLANLDPLSDKAPCMIKELDLATHNLSIWDLERHFLTFGLAGRDEMTLGAILEILTDAYCRDMGIEYMHLDSLEEKLFVESHVEGSHWVIEPELQRHLLAQLNAAEAFESFLHTRYVGQRRFGLEGAESAIVILDTILNQAISYSCTQAVIGMAHRGRLNVLVNIAQKSYQEMFAEFEGNLDPETVQGSGDVKYHKGVSGKFISREGLSMPVTICSNPSHLEAVDPVVEGITKAKLDMESGQHPFSVLPILVHGDAAFIGQGVVAETMNLSQVEGYKVGGTIHLVINNQIGFTTPPESARSSRYATDIAKSISALIIHVNGDDPEACYKAANLAAAYRERFHKDVVIDMVCYRRHGHNEGDDPSYTQPVMYKKIDSHRSVRKIYTETLIKRGDITLVEAEQALSDYLARLQTALNETRSIPSPVLDHLPDRKQAIAEKLSVARDVDKELLDKIAGRLHTVPDHFALHPKLARQLASRQALYSQGEIDWSLGELLAYGTLLCMGKNIRISGQDTKRGTFSHRHAALVDYENGGDFTPLAHLAESISDSESPIVEKSASFQVYDSTLSEYAALGFEYGYSTENTEALVIWEAQFGDFANGAQIIIDQFLVAAEEKWGQASSLVLYLPHGYEGQGAEHSSARLERFLALSAGQNITVTQPTTSAQMFHLIRAQALRNIRKPLVVMTPKSLLRAKHSRSPQEDLLNGHFFEVLDDPRFINGSGKDRVEKIILCSGKIAYDALARSDMLRSDDGSSKSAVVRLEQLYPWPAEEIASLISTYGSAKDVVFLQDEPENMGSWFFVHEKLHKILRDNYKLVHVTRAPAGSPATGSHAIHDAELEDLLTRAIGAK